jgi:dTDP-glucose 4,6-dehydratase
MTGDDTTTWSQAELDALKSELGDAYRGRTCLVTGADGFMGSHLTEALVAVGANVIAFVRATSSGALNNIGHLRRDVTVVFADLTDKTSVDYLIRDHLVTAADRPYIFHLGAQAHVGESWHRPYETVMANTFGTLNLLQSIVDHDVELEKFDTAGTSEEYGNVDEAVAHQHDFDELGGLILHERSPINPKSIYATSKVAADFLTMNYHDAYGIPGVVTRMFNNYGPRQNPRYVTGTIITQALTSWARSSRCATSVSRPTACAATSPSQQKGFPATCTSTGRARTSRCATGARRSSRSALPTASGATTGRS